MSHARWSPPASVHLRDGEVHVWRAPLDGSAMVQRMRDTLAADECARADRFRLPRDRDRFIIARGIRRDILARYLRRDPRALRFRENPYGKPAVVGGGDALHFNVSHAGGIALFAVAQRRMVGVDLEQMLPDLPWEQIAARYFAPPEVAALRALPALRQRAAFFTCWTRKEAYIKARGEGLSRALDQFAVSLAPDGPTQPIELGGPPREAARWSLHGVDPGAGYVGAVAIEGDALLLRYWDWPGLADG